jgi:hypothetical protein
MDEQNQTRWGTTLKQKSKNRDKKREKTKRRARQENRTMQKEKDRIREKRAENTERSIPAWLNRSMVQEALGVTS